MAKKQSNEFSFWFYRYLQGYQDEYLEMSHRFIAEFLQHMQNEGKYKQAVDWLIGKGGDQFFKLHGEAWAFNMAQYALERFEFDDEDAEENEDVPEDVYTKLANYFDIGIN
jgi:hypothetical protein